MDSVEDYARKWAKQEDVDVDTLSEWVKSVRNTIKKRIHLLRTCMNTKNTSIFKDQNVVDNLSSLHEEYVVVPADKASNNVVFVCKKYYVECLIRELGINGTSGNPTYTATTLSKEEIIDNHKSIIASFGLHVEDDDCELPRLYWIPKLHKNPYKQRYIAGSFKCSTKPLSKLLTTILSAVKDGIQTYCDVAFSRSGVNQMWILKNSKELLTSIKTFFFNTLYHPPADTTFRLKAL